jgi:hypothetical protein
MKRPDFIVFPGSEEFTYYLSIDKYVTQDTKFNLKYECTSN